MSVSQFFRISCHIHVTCAATSFILPISAQECCVNENYFMQIVDLSMICHGLVQYLLKTRCLAQIMW